MIYVEFIYLLVRVQLGGTKISMRSRFFPRKLSGIFADFLSVISVAYLGDQLWGSDWADW